MTSTIPTNSELLGHVASVYADAVGEQLDNQTLYSRVAERVGITAEQRKARSPIGRSGQLHSVIERKLRWHQQSLRQLGVIKKVEGKRGLWELAETNKAGLHTPAPGVRLLAFSTDLGIAIWGDSREVFRSIDEPIHAIISSPPYPLHKPRAYGGPTFAEYTDFIIDTLEPLVRTLAPGGCVSLNVGQDAFIKGTPARSMYIEELLIALRDRLGLFLHDRLVWSNPSKAPGPVRWASMQRVQLNVGYEPVYVLTNDPTRVFADNRRVLEPHTERHQQLISTGGEQRHASYADGAYRLHPGRFSNPTAGRIPKNVITRGHRCADAIEYRRCAKALDLPAHGAVMPTSLAEFLVAYLTEPDHLCVDPWAGKGTIGLAAERLGRRWIIADRVLDYLRPGGECFRNYPGYDMPDAVRAWPRQSEQESRGFSA